LHEAIANGQITVGLKWKDTSGAPAIKLYSSASPDGSDNYLRDEGTAIEQTAGDHGFNQGEIRSRGDAFFFPTTYWSNVSDDLSKKHFIFEGSGEGKGQMSNLQTSQWRRNR
jgi:hypothetical protein